MCEVKEMKARGGNGVAAIVTFTEDDKKHFEPALLSTFLIHCTTDVP
jgi:hypothetical protein